MKKINYLKYIGVSVVTFTLTMFVMTYLTDYLLGLMNAQMSFTLFDMTMDFVGFQLISSLSFDLIWTVILVFMLKHFVEKCRKNPGYLSWKLNDLEKECWCCYMVVLVAILAGFMLKNPVFIIFASLAIVILNTIYSVILVLKKDLKNIAVSKVVS
ncbi:MAG: hypothetical protein WAR39_03270 [Prevotella sp.]|jgi:hypothetical protein